MLYKKTMRIQGFRKPEGNQIQLDGRPIYPDNAEGFDWGYEGPRTESTAHTILLSALWNHWHASAVYRQFTRSNVSTWSPGGDFDVTFDFHEFVKSYPYEIEDADFQQAVFRHLAGY